MARAKAQGYCGKPGTCRWCGTKFSKVYDYRPSIKTLVKSLAPIRCSDWPYWCGNTTFVRDPLPNPTPYRCTTCSREYEGRWVEKKQGERRLLGDSSRGEDGFFCSQKCGEMFANAAVLVGLSLTTEVVATEEVWSKGRFRVTKAVFTRRGPVNVSDKAGPRGRPATLQEGDHTA